METLQRFSIKKNQTDIPVKRITSSKDACDYIKQFYHEDIEVYESMFLLLLDRNNTTVGYAKISQGGVAGTYVDVKIIGKYVLDNLASGAIMAHNHPSGNLKPSQPDRDITKKVKEMMTYLDCKLLDHLILSVDGYYSFADEGIL